MHPTTSRAVQLPKLLSLLKKDGQGADLFQTRWKGKGLPVPTAKSTEGACRWHVTRSEVQLMDGKISAKAWGVLYWKGKRVTPPTAKDERITGGLKYAWASAVSPPILVQPTTAPEVTEKVEA